MNYCPNCGIEVKKGAKFCPNCGNEIHEKILPAEDVKQKRQMESPTNRRKSFSGVTKVLLIGFGVVILYFVAMILYDSSSDGEPLFVIEEETAKIEGEWYDPTGVIWGSKTTRITLKAGGPVVDGVDVQHIIELSLIPIDKNTYGATVILNGVKGDFKAFYDEDQQKLAFVSELTKSSWSIQKVK